MSRFYPNFVHQNGKSKLCLGFVQVQSLSNELKSGQSLDKSLSGFLSIDCPYFVHLWLYKLYVKTLSNACASPLLPWQQGSFAIGQLCLQAPLTMATGQFCNRTALLASPSLTLATGQFCNRAALLSNPLSGTILNLPGNSQEWGVEIHTLIKKQIMHKWELILAFWITV